jgi:hypothetical protein
MISRVVPIADAHSGLKVGLMPPKVIEGEGTQFQRTIYRGKTQKWLGKKWDKAHDVIFDGTADEVIIFIMGDAVHGLKDTAGIWTGSLKTQKDAFIETHLAWANKASCTYCIRGTRWHVGDDGIVEDQIAQELGCYKLKSFHKMEVEIQGVRFMLAHKGPRPGSRAWTRPNSMFHTLKDRHITALQLGLEPADVYLWGHYHEYVPGFIEAEGPWGAKIISGYVLPAWCTPNEYALEHVGNLEVADVGIVYFDVEDGKVTKHDLWTKFDAVERVSHISRIEGIEHG